MYKQAHYRTDLSCGDGMGRAFWAIEPTGVGIVFVHGFGGGPSETWLQFDSMLAAESACRGCDLLFYSYNSLRRQVRPSSGLFRQFLDQLFTEPVTTANRALGETLRREPFSYQRIVLVAHSMGAVVSRLALIGAHREARRWLPLTKLVLFAPAHKGARVQLLAMSALSGIRWVGGLAGAVPYFYPPLADLERDSPLLAQMLSDTEDAIAKPGGARLLASKVVYGLEDNVIFDVRFSEDPEEIVVPHKGHLGVCKPASDYLRPVKVVMETL